MHGSFARASMCDDPGLLPVNHVEIARCQVVTNGTVSDGALITVEAADICVVRGRDSLESGDGVRYRQNTYYIGGRISYRDTYTGQLISVENFGQYWWNWADIIYPFSRSCIRENDAGIFFHEAVSCGVLEFQKYRISGQLDKTNKTLRYTFINCDKQTELDFELHCEMSQ
jgi:hypothetical protein